MIKGERLREMRQQHQWTQEYLGKVIGQDGQYISKLEREVLPGMTVEILERLCDALRCSTDYLLGRENESPA
jgi:transcriptional regulator with XRE-family HTH domain